MFCYKNIKKLLIEEQQKNAALTEQNDDIMAALVELADIAAAQDDALVELAEMAIEQMEGGAK